VNYRDFLATKQYVAPMAGVDVDIDDVNPVLYPFQRQLVQWALRKGRCALFADCGLGKTFMQLEWARLTGERTLILTPLAVASQTVAEAARLGIGIVYARNEDQAADSRIVVTNYEMMEHFDAGDYGAVVLDESSILKSQDGKTRTRLIEKFRETPCRLCCSATPAPNDIAEFANHSEFLGVASREELLATFFVHDEDGWRLKGHARDAFYRWMASWAMMLKSPSDIGFPDEGFRLPPLTVQTHWSDYDSQAVAQAQGQLFVTNLKGITGRAAVRKETIEHKVSLLADTINADTEQWLVWCGLNDEGRAAHAAIAGSVLVEGSDSIEHKVDSLMGFAEGRYRVLITKPSIAGFGMNFQRCHKQAFLGMSDSYEQYYQATRRSWRFGQTKPVEIHIVLTELERSILENVQAKEQLSEETARGMVQHVSEFQQAELGMLTVSRNGYHESDAEGEGWRLMLGDCVERMREIPNAIVDMSVFSPPFLSLYVYSDSERDMGNSKTESEFFQHYGFMLGELRRIMKPGRNVACHISQVPAQLAKDGYIGLRDFRGPMIQAFIDHGFIYHGECVIDKDPQAQAIRTKSKGLLFAQLKKDASWLRPGLADFILVFRVPGDNAVPIHPDIDNETWIRWARPIWYGIRESDTLNVREGRSEQDERHIAPLQLETIERCVRLWSNKGEMVFSPYAGIGSEGYQSLLLGRRFIGTELKPEYWRTACLNLERAVTRTKQGMLL
jgi:DNA modification methylase